MKKQLFALLFGAVIILTFASCNKYQESMYNKSDYQIKYIWHKSNVGNPNEVFSYDKHKMLTNITITDTTDPHNLISDNFDFSYNKDKTVKTISYSDGTNSQVIEFAYLNRYVKYMSYSYNGTVRFMANFYRDDEKAAKITRITETYERAFFEENHLQNEVTLYDHFIGNRDRIASILSNPDMSKDLSLYCNKTITYSGDNITMITEEYPDSRKSIVTANTYSKINNPYFGLNYAYSKDLIGFSKNSLESQTITIFYDGVPTDMELIEYTYPDVNKDNYPRISTSTSSKHPGIYFKDYITYVSEYKGK